MADTDIAIIGIAAHLPGAPDPATYWQNLVGGVESIRPLSEQELLDAGVTRTQLSLPSYVPSAATLDGVYDFDADFFGLSPKEAGIMDPQHRHFLAAAWEALEDAAHVPDSFEGAIGVFAGCGQGSYYMNNLLSNEDLVRDVGLFLLRHTGNDKDFLATRASYVFDLRGPSVNVQTACSTSLVATHLATQHLLSGECDLALAGGVTIEVPHGQGYLYHEGEVLSPDGHCRAFDRRAKGTVFGSGAGVVALRRLDDALDDGDRIYAVVKGTAVNNDGANKVGYLAPSVEGQAACVIEALAVADVDASTVGYVECHGTGTPMGDPIELAALTQAFQDDEDSSPADCRVGSVKTNIGHLDTAAGVASLVKVSLALHHGAIPASLNFEEANPELGLERSPFSVNDELFPWPATAGTPRRAGVNSLGVGGTNAFAVLEEAPLRAASPPADGLQLLTLSARSTAALDAACDRLADHLEAHPDLELADVAWTLHVGRKAFSERRVLAVRSHADAIEQLRSRDRRSVFTHTASSSEQSLTFLFPGGGSQHAGMAAGLHETEPEFARHIDAGLQILEAEHGLDLRSLLLDRVDGDARAVADARLDEPHNQFPSIFLVEYALARLLISRGLEPTGLVGHSLGETTAACVAGTMSFADCLGLAVLRGKLMGSVSGGLVAVPLPADELAPMIEELELDLAVVNAPELTVVSGPSDRLDQLTERLSQSGVEALVVPVGSAPHSRLLDPILDDFRAGVEAIDLQPPQIPWVSNRTGTWIEDDVATDPGYWVEHLRNTVHFSDCLATLAKDPSRVMLEVGPGKTLSSLARMHPDLKSSQVAIPMMRHADDDVADDAALLAAIGRLWAVGGTLDTDALFDADVRQRVGLPTYPFQTQTYFIAPGAPAASDGERVFVEREPDEDRWFWKPVWKSADRDEPSRDASTWLVFLDRSGVGSAVVDELRARDATVVTVELGDSYRRRSDTEYQIAPELGLSDYERLVADLVRTGNVPDRVALLGLLARDASDFRPGSSFFHRNQELGFQSLVLFAQAWAGAEVQHPVHITVATMGAQAAPGGSAVPWPEQATVLGPVRVIPREFADVTVSAVDLDPAEVAAVADLRRGRRTASSATRHPLVDELVEELVADGHNEVVALRGDRRYVADVRHAVADDAAAAPTLRRGGVVVVTGGLGGIGLTVAEELAERHGARIALLSRSGLPDREVWDELLERLGDDHPTAVRIRRVRALEERAEVLVLSGDVTDLDQMRSVLDSVRERFGAIHGVVHGAGLVDDALLVAKPQPDMEDVLAPKVYGTLVLDQLTRDDDLDLFVLFSSTSTVIAPLGQVDYVGANAFLNAFAESCRGQGRDEVVAVNWGVWSAVGMAADAGAQLVAVERSVQERADAHHPLLRARTTDDAGVTRISASWPTEGTWMLDDHRTAAGEALVPGAAYLELARAALAEIGVDRPFEIRDLTFLRPLAAPDGGTTDVEIVLTADEQGYRFEVRERVVVGAATAEDDPSAGVSGWRRTAEAALHLHRQPPAPRLDLVAEALGCPTRDGTRTHQEDHLRFGPRWDVVTRVQRGDGVSMAWLDLPDEFAGDLDDFGLHPALVDLGTGFAMRLIEGYTGDQLWVPVGYRSVRVYGRLPRSVVARVAVVAGSTEANGFASFNVSLCADDGQVLVHVTGFTIKRLDGPLDVGLGRRALASETELDAAPGNRSLSTSELAFQHNLRQGIEPEEGRRAFATALSMGLPVVYATSMDLVALRTQGTAIADDQLRPEGAGSGAVFERPELASEYLGPRNDIEEMLVGIWQELLGISQVGVRDDFFDLGGHSLIAVRLFTKVKRQYSVDFPISVLFEAPTVEAVAELIAGALPDTSSDSGSAEDPDGAQGSDGSSTIVASRPRFSHLVPMHPSEGVARTPFFLVAGMFGNVLNLRHLAHQIGTDRPFYGVQARGLFGDEQPHENFEEMAADYLAEVREVQPHGPYLLGGFSGGGIAAYEMAQQLRAVGEEVALLVMLDTPIAEHEPLGLPDRLRIQGENLRTNGIGYLREWAVSKYRYEREVRRRRREGLDTFSDEGVLHSTVIEAAFYRALAVYDTKPYEGVITLYRPKLTPLHVLSKDRQVDINRRYVYHDNGWSRFCERVDVTETPGDHDSMVLEPNVRVLSANLRRAIDDATSGPALSEAALLTDP